MKYEDPIAKAYRKMVSEAFSMGPKDKWENQEYDYFHSVGHGWDEKSRLGNIGLMKSTKGPFIHYRTVDHDSKLVLHHADFLREPAGHKLPFESEHQIDVGVYEDASLPKHYATEVAYNHFKDSSVPLRSSDDQHTGGHKMWKHLAKKALDDGYYVYHIDTKSNVLHPVSKDGLDFHHIAYYHYNEDKGHSNHLILSKTPIKL